MRPLDASSIRTFAAPAVGAFFQARVAKMPSYVAGDIFVPPAGLILPERYYFQCGRPGSTAELRADDEAGIASLHAQLQRDVEAGIDTLRECREGGFDCAACRDALREAVRAMTDAGFTLRECDRAGFSKAEMGDAFVDAREWKVAGMTAADAKAAGFGAAA